MQRTPIPALRRDLDVQVRRNGTVDVRDPVLFQVYNLDGDDFEMARRFDGRKTAEQLATEDVPVDQVDALAEEFRELFLLDVPEVWEQEPALENLSPHSQLSPSRKRLKVLPEPLDGARWSCRACGACCHGLTVEIRPDEEARIDPSLYQDVLQGEDFAEWSFLDPDDSKKRVLRQLPERKNACIFLDERGLCRIHARQGMEAKPDACQVYPHVVVHVPKGPPRLALRLNCESMHETFERGPPITSHLPDVLRVHETSPGLRAPKTVEFFGESVPFSEFDQVLRDVIDIFREEGVGPDSLQKIDRLHCGGRARRARRRFGKNLLGYVEAERDADVPVQEGAFFPALRRLKRGRVALEAMRRGAQPPPVGPRVNRFLTRQATEALWGLGPLNVPDGGYGLASLLLGLEAVLHAVGSRGRLATANTAFWVFTGPLIETPHHVWPFLEALDAGHADALRADL